MNQPHVSPLNDRSRYVSFRAARWQVLFALVLLASALVPMGPRFTAPAGAEALPTELVPAVQVAAGKATGAAPDAITVEIVEEIDAWAFGTAAIPADASDAPQVTFFLARRESSGTWTVALRYTGEFTALLTTAPASFPSTGLRTSLEDVFTIAGDGGAQLSFPFPAGETWYFQGPHDAIRPWTGLDFSAGDFTLSAPVGTVVAMRGGTVYRPCDGMVMIDHGDGWITGYYHVDPVTVSNGQTVARGEAIGFTSMNYVCGGYASSNHVHIWTEYRGVRMPIAGQDIGGWTVEEGPGVYFGCLVKGADRRCRLPDGNWNNNVTNGSDIGSGGLASVDVVEAAGTVGGSLAFTLTGFPSNAAVSIIWKRPGGSTVGLAPVTTNASGGYTGQFTIPVTTSGDANTVTFTSGSSSRTVRIMVHPRVTAAPVSVASGAALTLTVSGFSKKQTVNFTLTPDFGESIPLGSLLTSNTGGGKLIVTVPNGLESGPITIEAKATGDLIALETIQIANGPSIIAPTTGQRVGASFSYSVTGFPAGSAITIDIRNASTGTVVATLPGVTTNAVGNASGSGAWPIAPAGEYRIVASTSGASAERFVSLGPALLMPAGTVQRGALIALTAHGMAPGSAVTFAWLTDPSPVTLGSALADVNGTATLQVTVPAAQDGSITLNATDGGRTAFGPLEIAGGPMPGPASATASPSRGTVNTWVSFSIANFPANSAVLVKWVRPSGGSIDLSTVQTDGAGSATGKVRVPATPGGMNGVRFTSGTVTTTVPYEVVARIKVTPSVTERGGMVDISLRGYGKQEVVRIRWKKGMGWIELAQITTSNTGSANVQIRVPDWAPDGLSSVRGDGATFRAQTNAVTVSGGATLMIASESATPSPTATATATPQETATPSETAVPSATPVDPAPATETPTPEPTIEETPPPSPTAEPTETVTPEPPVEPTEIASAEATETAVAEDGTEGSQ